MPYWLHRTNEGRVVYDRKPHLWTEKDIERIVKSFQENQTEEVLFMSDIADRVIWWLGRRLGVDEVVAWATARIAALFLMIQGNTPEFAQPRITTEEQELIDWVSEQAGSGAGPDSGTTVWKDTRAGQLEELKARLGAMIEWIDVEIGGL